MADLKRWFKVWTTILSDSDFDPERPGTMEDLGKFVWLGAYVAQHGDSGTASIAKDTLFRKMRVTALSQLTSRLALHNVLFEEGKTRHGDITVILKNWHKYQVDTTMAERQQRSRAKKRGEERRREENKEDSYKNKN